METKTYNGWRNYETWAVALWLDNEQGAQEYWQEVTECIAKEGDSDDQAHVLAEQLQSEVEELKPDLGCSLYSDLLTASLSEIDWHEIAHSYLDEVRSGYGAKM